ncbi:hypothetical protein JXA84_09975 [candidate division WOR-3 bacterium]|nr:hypothetical protein [candidate division WOR-3 bacterium]
MLMPSEKAYKETKLIIFGKSEIKPEFLPLARWIDKEFKVKTINIYYDTIDEGKRPRLGVFFESSEEAESFHENGQFSNFDAKKQKMIADKFKQVNEEHELTVGTDSQNFLKGKKTEKYIVDNLLVYTDAFEPAAKIEANENIPQESIEELKRSLNCPDLWEISRSFSKVNFFLLTDDQVKKYSKIAKEWEDRYFDLLVQYDEFGYFERESFSIGLDSKENLIKNYEGNWFYYYK